MIPPMLLRVSIRNGRRRFCLWLPLFLIGPLFLLFFLVAAVLVLPFLLIAVVVLWCRGAGKWILPAVVMLLQVGPLLVVLLCALRGLRVEVQNGPQQRVYVSFR